MSRSSRGQGRGAAPGRSSGDASSGSSGDASSGSSGDASGGSSGDASGGSSTAAAAADSAACAIGSRDVGAQAPPLFGLVLAGGESRRMGTDKGALVVRGEPQVRRAWRLLNGLCVCAYVSARPEQAEIEAYRGLPVILDDRRGLGPAAGLLAAWQAHPEVAWLVLATDMPLVDEGLVAELIRGRDAARAATCFRQADGLLQPLCAIWEPSARDRLDERIAHGDASLRRLLETERVRELAPTEPERLASADTEEAYRRLPTHRTESRE